jgi:hypothetical protein
MQVIALWSMISVSSKCLRELLTEAMPAHAPQQMTIVKLHSFIRRQTPCGPSFAASPESVEKDRNVNPTSVYNLTFPCSLACVGTVIVSSRSTLREAMGLPSELNYSRVRNTRPTPKSDTRENLAVTQNRNVNRTVNTATIRLFVF